MERSVISLAASRISAFLLLRQDVSTPCFYLITQNVLSLPKHGEQHRPTVPLEFHHVESVLLPYPCIRKKATTIYLPRLKAGNLPFQIIFIPAPETCHCHRVRYHNPVKMHFFFNNPVNSSWDKVAGGR